MVLCNIEIISVLFKYLGGSILDQLRVIKEDEFNYDILSKKEAIECIKLFTPDHSFNIICITYNNSDHFSRYVWHRIVCNHSEAPFLSPLLVF
jgi:hypothetical protein